MVRAVDEPYAHSGDTEAGVHSRGGSADKAFHKQTSRTTTDVKQAGDPVVSVVMSVRDGARFLREAIESILCQSLGDFEIIVIDDGSRDETPAILRSFADADARVRAITRDGTRGWVASVNAGCELARGQYIARLDADDVALSDRLARQVGAFEADPRLVLVGSTITLIDDGGTTVGEQRFPTDDASIKVLLPDENCFAQSSVMFSRTAFERSGRYRPAYTHAEDYDLWLRLAEQGRVRNLAEPLVQYRLHGSSNTAKNLEFQVASALAAQISARARNDGKKEPFGSMWVTPRSLVEQGVPATALQTAVASQYIAWAMLGRKARTYHESLDLLVRSRNAISGMPDADDIIGRGYLAQSRLDVQFGRRSRAVASLARALRSNPRLTRVIVLAGLRFARKEVRDRYRKTRNN